MSFNEDVEFIWFCGADAMLARAAAAAEPAVEARLADATPLLFLIASFLKVWPAPFDDSERSVLMHFIALCVTSILLRRLRYRFFSLGYSAVSL